MKKTLLILFFLGFWVFAHAQNNSSPSDSVQYNNLMMMSLEELMNIEITTASKTSEKLEDAPAVVSVITQNDIQNYGANNLLDLLDRVTSIYTLGSALLPDNMVSIRGDATTHYNNRVLVLINGRPFRDNIGGGIRMALHLMFPISRVARLEIIRGPGSVLYGTGAYTGVINIITKEADKQQESVSIQGGGFGRTQASVAAGHKMENGLRISGGVNALKETGWDFEATDNGLFGSFPRTKRSIKMLQEGVGCDLNVGYKGFTANAFYGNSKQRAMYFPQAWSAYNKISNGDTTFVYKDYNAINSVFFADLGYNASITDKWDIAVNTTLNDTRLTEASEGANDNIAKSFSTDWIAEITNSIKLGTKGTLLIGGLANGISGKQTFPISTKKAKTAASPFEATGFGSFNIYNDNLGKNPDAPYIIEPYSEIWYSGYFQADYKVLPKLKLVAGAQLNKVPHIDADVVPRLGAIYNFNEEVGAKLLYGEAFRVGSSSERFVKVDFVLGSENLKPEKMKTTELMLFFKDSNGKFNSTLTYFHSNQSNLINRSAQAARDNKIPANELVINTGERLSQGLEFDFTYNISKEVSMQGSLTVMNSRDKVKSRTAANRDTVYEVSNYQATPQSMAKVGINYNHPNGVSFGIFDSFFDGAMRTNQFGNQLVTMINPEIKAFHWLSMQVQANVGRLLKTKSMEGLQLGIFGKNMLDQKVMVADPQFGVNAIPGRGGRQVVFTLNYTL